MTQTFALLVYKVEAEPNPIKGSDKVKCHLCHSDCWRAPSSDKTLDAICWDCFFNMWSKLW